MIYFQMVRFRKEKMTMSTNGANRTQIPREGQLLQIWTGTGYWDTRGSYSTTMQQKISPNFKFLTGKVLTRKY